MKTDVEFSLLDVFDLPNLQREIVLYLACNGPADVTALAQATGEIPAFASLRYATFQLPATDVRELKVWAHQITPEENAQGLPALLNVRCGSEKQEFDLKQSGGQVVLPMSGEACRLEVTLTEVIPA